MTPSLHNEDTQSQIDDAVFDNAAGGDLIPAGVGGEIATMSPEDFALVSTAGDFLPRLQLYGGNSTAAKEGKIGIGCFGIVRAKDTIEDLGKTVDVIIVDGRAKALRVEKDNTIITKFDPNDVEFKKIMAESNIKDSGCMYGPEFLLYVPAAEAFVTYFMSSKTARRVAKNVYARMRKGATLGAELIKTQKYSWHGPTCVSSSAPFDNLPTEDEFRDAAAKFKAEKPSEVETVTGGDANGRKR
jgi:hypothetical protein